MKDLKKSLEKVASDLNKAAKQVEKLAGDLKAKRAKTNSLLWYQLFDGLP